ncbi:hypothetical protein EV291_111116 [Rhizobium sp. BK068]|nr:hypothetical protein EV291_111116 [Rhizobium sp. BK068]
MLGVDHVVEHPPDRLDETRIDRSAEDVRKSRVCLPVVPGIADQDPPVHPAEAFLKVVGQYRPQGILDREDEGIDRGELLDPAGVDPVDHQPLLVYGYLLEGLDLDPFADTVAQEGLVESAHVRLEVIHLLRGTKVRYSPRSCDVG